MEQRSSFQAAADAKLAWIVGGSLLAASAVVGLVLQPVTALVSGGDLVASILFASGLVVFAIGLRGSGSVTARRPLGTAALLVLAAWTLLVSILGVALFSTDLPLGALLGFGYVDSLIRFAAALVAVVQIARAGTIRRPWNWAPGWLLAAATALWLIQQALGASGGQSAGTVAPLVWTLEGIVNFGGPVFLGVVAIVLANRSSREQTVPIYPQSRRDDPSS